MSSFIEHNRAVFFTKDQGVIVLVKGGDNNVYSVEGNRACEWQFWGIAPSWTHFVCHSLYPAIRDSYDSNGTLQLHNPPVTLNLFGYKYHVLKLWSKAAKKKITLPFTMEEVFRQGNSLLEPALRDALKENGYSLLDEDGLQQQYFIPVFGNEKLWWQEQHKRYQWIRNEINAQKIEEVWSWIHSLIKHYQKGYVNIDEALLAKDVNAISLYLNFSYNAPLGMFGIFNDVSNMEACSNYPVEYLYRHLTVDCRKDDLRYVDPHHVELLVNKFPRQLAQIVNAHEMFSGLSLELQKKLEEAGFKKGPELFTKIHHNTMTE